MKEVQFYPGIRTVVGKILKIVQISLNYEYFYMVIKQSETMNSRLLTFLSKT